MSGLAMMPPVGVDSVSSDSLLPSRSTTDAPRIRVRTWSAAARSIIRSSTVSAGPRTSMACPPGRRPGWRSTRVTE
jgi:hypothetical protein